MRCPSFDVKILVEKVVFSTLCRCVSVFPSVWERKPPAYLRPHDLWWVCVCVCGSVFSFGSPGTNCRCGMWSVCCWHWLWSARLVKTVCGSMCVCGWVWYVCMCVQVQCVGVWFVCCVWYVCVFVCACAQMWCVRVSVCCLTHVNMTVVRMCVCVSGCRLCVCVCVYSLHGC